MSCSDDTEVGYGLLEDEDLEIQFKDDIELIAKTIDRGPIRTYSFGQATLASIVLGEMNDPDFGKLRSEIYFSPSLLTNFPQEFAGGIYDSLIFTIRIDSSLSYGSSVAEHNISIHKLISPIVDDTLNSSQFFPVESDLLGSVFGVIPSRIDSVTVPDGLSDTSTIKLKDIIRIPLNDRFGRSLFVDTAAHTSTTLIRERFAGFRVSDETENSVFGVRNTSYITLYYHDAEGNFREYIYYLNGGPLTPHITHDYAGTSVETLLDVPVSESSYLYLEGISGTDVSIDISGLRELDNILINHASLEFYLVDDEGRDTLLYPSAQNLFLQKEGDLGLIDIEDVIIATSFVGDLRHFGGFREEDTETNKIKYEMNITTHLIDVLNGREGDILYLRIANKVNNPATAVLYGPNHPQFPARLKLTYTKS
jgi:hypothetical protein